MNEQRTRRERRRYSVAERTRWAQQYERSGKRMVEFCSEHGLVQSNLSRWVRQSREGAVPSQRSGSLVEVAMRPEQPSAGASAARVLLPGGAMMEVSGGTDARWLAAVLRALMLAEG